MLTLPASVRVYMALAPCDMRRGFDALTAMVRESFGDDPLSGHLFVFRSRRGDRLKVLWWDRDGLALWYKRLEQGVFRLDTAARATPPASPTPSRNRRPRATQNSATLTTGSARIFRVLPRIPLARPVRVRVSITT